MEAKHSISLMHNEAQEKEEKAIANWVCCLSTIAPSHTGLNIACVFAKIWHRGIIKNLYACE